MSSISRASPRAKLTWLFRDLLNKIGTAPIEFFGDDEGETCTIVLPQYHPGYDTRTDQSKPFRRLYFHCWIQVWVYVDTAVMVLDSEPNPTRDRYSLCQDIIARADARLEAVGFKNTLTDARQAFAQCQKSKQ